MDEEEVSFIIRHLFKGLGRFEDIRDKYKEEALGIDLQTWCKKVFYSLVDRQIEPHQAKRIFQNLLNTYTLFYESANDREA